jgi:hypothetical protein
LDVKINNMSSKFAIPFFQKSPLYGAYTSGADGMVTISDAPHYAKLQEDIGNAVSKAYAKKNDPCSDPNTVQYTENSVLKKCPKKTKPNPKTNTTYTMPTDLERIANKGKNTKKPETKGKRLPSTYDFLTDLGKGIQDKAVENVKKALDPKRNNQIQEED